MWSAKKEPGPLMEAAEVEFAFPVRSWSKVSIPLERDHQQAIGSIHMSSVSERHEPCTQQLFSEAVCVILIHFASVG